jgi:hypothetical protein
MPWPPSRPPTLARQLAPYIGGGGAGLISALAGLHDPAVAGVAAVAFTVTMIAGSLAKIAESVYKHRAAIIEARGEARAKIITAKGDTEILKSRDKTLQELCRAGLDPSKTELAAEMARLHAAITDLPADRRLDEQTRARLLTMPTTGSTGPTPGGNTRRLAAVPDPPDVP